MPFDRLRAAGLAGLLLLSGAASLPMRAADCSGVPSYASTSVYTNGMQVVYNSQLWKAQWWTQNEAPSKGGSGVWLYVADCGSVASCTTPPAVPSGLAASGITSTSVNLSWTAVSTPANCSVTYSVFRSGTQLSSGLTGTSTTITGLTANTAYSFTVAAVDAAGSSAMSSPVSVTTSSDGGNTGSCAGVPAYSATAVYTNGMKVVYNNQLWNAQWWTQGEAPSNAGSGVWKYLSDCSSVACSTAPAVPSGLASGNLTSTGVTLSWGAVAAPAGCTVSYKVYQNGVQVGTPSTNSLSLTNLTANTTYSFTVASADAAGTSTQGAALSVKTPSAGTCAAAPAVPTGLASTNVTGTSADLSWAAVSSPANCSVTYRVYSRGIQIQTGLTATSTTISGLTANTSYSFTVAAVDAAGISAQSTALAVKTAGATCAAAPAVPTGLASANVTSSSVVLSWTAVTSPANCSVTYRVYSRGIQIQTGLTATSTTISGLTANTTYSFTVAAVDAAGISAQSAILAVQTTGTGTCTAVPSVPTGLASSNVTSSGLSLSWNAATAGSGCAVTYTVYKDGAVAVSGLTGTSTSISGLAASTTYSFTVAAVDGAGSSSQSSALSVTTSPGGGGSITAKVGYFIQWGIYARAYYVKNLVTSGAADKLTHINYAFANIDPVNLTVLNGQTHATSSNPEDPNQGDGGNDAWADYQKTFSDTVSGVADTWNQTLAGNFNQLKELKAKYPKMHILMSIGGWTYSKYFSDVAATDASRKKFVASAIDAYIKGNLPSSGGYGGPGSAAGIFDGIDIDWEWPGVLGHVGNHFGPNDKANFVLLMKEFRTQLDALGGQHYLLTAFGPADPDKIAVGWDLPALAQYIDIFNVQGYDFHGAGSDNSWEPNRTGHQSNLYLDPNDPYPFHFSCDSAIQNYLNVGISPQKLTLGLPFYGRGWKGVAAGGQNGQWQTANGAAPGQFGSDNLESGTRETYNLNSSVGGTVYHDTRSIATYKFTGDGGEWWSYDDAWCIGQKANYIKSKNLLGAMIWEMCGDDGTLMNAIQ